MTYYKEQHVDAEFNQTVDAVRGFLDGEGYVVPAEINVTESFRNMLEKEFRDYVILMVGKPDLAYEAMSADPHLGAVLPVHIVIFAGEDGCTVSTLAPTLMKQTGNDTLAELGKTFDELLTRLFENLSATSGRGDG